MIILINPMWSIPEKVNFDSNYVHHSIIAQELAKNHPDWLFMWLWSSSDNFRYFNDGLFDNPQMIRIPYNAPTAKMEAAVHFDAVFWRKALHTFDRESIPADIIWNNVIEIGHLIKHCLNTYHDKSRPTVVNSHHFVVHPTLPTNLEAIDHIRWAQVLSFFGVDYNIFNSAYCRKMLFDNVNELLNPDFIESHMKPSEILHMSLVDGERYKKLKQPKFEQMSFIYNHRLEGYKNWQTTFKIFEQLYSESPTFKVYVTGVDSKNLNAVSHYPFVVFATNLADHDEYLKLVSKCHINTLNSQHETFCISAVESMAMGNILVAPNAITFPELVPKGYRYLFDSTDGQREILRSLIKHYPEAVGASLADSTLKRFAVKVYAAKLGSLFEKLLADKNILDKSKKADELRKLGTKLPDKITLSDAAKAIAAATNWSFSQVLTSVRVKRVMNDLGYAAKWNGSRLFFEKVK